MMRFRNRLHAGELLGDLLAHKITNPADGIVLGLPRGGVPVAAMVAHRLALPLDVLLVRKLGVPGHEEYAMGAIASGGVCVLNDDAIRKLGISDDTVKRVAARERIELERRERAFRGDRAPVGLSNRTVVVVDDGIATGASMISAIEAISVAEPESLIVAVPVAPRSTIARITPIVDHVFILYTPDPFSAVGLHYVDFTQTSDGEVQALLQAQGDPLRAEGGEH